MAPEIPPAPGATSSAAFGINGSGTVVGGSGNKPYRCHDGVMTVMAVPPPFSSGGARRISDAGFVTGIVGNEATTGRAYRWKDDNVTLLEPVGGHTASKGLGVNNLGWVVGSARTYLGLVLGFATTPTLWTESGAVALPLPSGYAKGSANSVNDQGVILGAVAGMQGQGIPEKAVIWLNGECYLVSDLLVEGAPTISTVIALNQTGRILSGGTAKVLSPVEPAIHDLNGDCAVDGSDLMKCSPSGVRVTGRWPTSTTTES